MLSIRTLLFSAIPIALLVGAGCGSPGPAAPGTASPQASPAAAVSGTPSAATPGALAVGSPSPVVTNATLDVSPAQVNVGGFVASLAFESPRHLVDQSTLTNAANVDPNQATPVVPDGGTKGGIVLSDMLRVTNNMDATQALPADAASVIVRHVMVRIATADTNQIVPYLGLSMDMLLDGRPVSFGQALVPMVAAEANPPAMYYGNNVRLTQRGMYQVFVRLTHNPLLGSGQPQAAQFNVQVH